MYEIIKFTGKGKNIVKIRLFLMQWQYLNGVILAKRQNIKMLLQKLEYFGNEDTINSYKMWHQKHKSVEFFVLDHI